MVERGVHSAKGALSDEVVFLIVDGVGVDTLGKDVVGEAAH